MMKFWIEKCASFGERRLVYNTVEYAFSTEPRPEGCVSSASINELELMLDEEDGRVVFVAGYCPHTGWRATAQLQPPDSYQACLHVDLEKYLVPGSSVSVDSKNERWPILVDPVTGWIRLGKGNPREDRDGVEFAPGAIAVLSGGHLAALWLHPEIEGSVEFQMGCPA